MTEPNSKLTVMLVEDDPAHAELTLRSIEELAPELCDVLTTSDAEDDRERALACGACSYLVKPFGAHELLAVTRVLGCRGFGLQRAPSA